MMLRWKMISVQTIRKLSIRIERKGTTGVKKYAGGIFLPTNGVHFAPQKCPYTTFYTHQRETYQYHKRYTRQFHRGFFVPGFFLATTHPALFWGFLFWIIFYEILTDSFEKWFNNSDVQGWNLIWVHIHPVATMPHYTPRMLMGILCHSVQTMYAIWVNHITISIPLT